jgi:hypothetical protein
MKPNTLVADDHGRRRWRADCLQRAHATYALAEACTDVEMIEGYLELAARWLALAETGPLHDL